MLFEPGRFLVAEAGVLLTRVAYLKPGETHDYAIVDAAMNDLIRPTLYDAYHEIIPVTEPSSPETMMADVVGPVCETSDTLGKAREIHYNAHIHWEWWTASNGAAFHAPDESNTSINKGIAYSQEGIKLLDDAMAKRRGEFMKTAAPAPAQAPAAAPAK